MADINTPPKFEKKEPQDPDQFLDDLIADVEGFLEKKPSEGPAQIAQPEKPTEPPPAEPQLPAQLAVEPAATPPAPEPETTPEVPPGPGQQSPEEPEKPEAGGNNGLKNAERLNPAELKDGDQVYVVNAVGSYEDEEGRRSNIEANWLGRDFTFKGLEEAGAELEDPRGNIITVSEGVLATAFAKRSTELPMSEIVKTIAGADEKPLDREKIFESYPIHLESGERIDIAPGQTWRWKTGSGKDERSDDFTIERIKLGAENGQLQIKFQNFEPVIRPTSEWQAIFSAGFQVENPEDAKSE